MRPIGHLLFEGCGTTAGYGDESKRGGYVGRIAWWAEQYNYVDKTNLDANTCGEIYVHQRGHPGRILPDYSGRIFNHHIEEIRTMNPYGSPISIVAIMAIGSFMNNMARRAEELFEPTHPRTIGYWKNSLTRLEQQVRQLHVQPVFIGSPVPRAGARHLNGEEPDSLLYKEIHDVTAAKLEGWATYMPFESLPGVSQNKWSHMAPDGIHPNARGHRTIAEWLLPTCCRLLGSSNSLAANRNIQRMSLGTTAKDWKL